MSSPIVAATPSSPGVAAHPSPPAAPSRAVDFATLLDGALTRTAAVGSASTNAAAPTTLGGMLASSAPVAQPTAAVRPTAPVPPVGSGDAIVSVATGYFGVPYRWGGSDPATGLDCSGLVQRVFGDLGVSLPRVSADQARAGTPVASLADARPGDLVYWRGRDGRPNHIGIYTGDGRMIAAPRTGDVVRYQQLRSAPPDAIRRIAVDRP